MLLSFPLILMSLPTGAWQIIGICLVISIALALMFYIFASITQHPDHKALAQENIAAFIFSLVIILFWLSFDSFLFNVISALINTAEVQSGMFKGLPIGHINLALLQLEVFRNELFSLYLRLALIDFFLGFMSTLSFNLGTLPGGIGLFSLYIAPYGGIGLISNALTTVVDGVGLLVLAVWGKSLLMIFVKNVIPLVLLPFGIVLRSNPFTRTTGSTIIAVCFALYFVYPLAVMLSFYTIFDVYGLKFDYNYIEQASPFKTQMSQSDINNMINDIKNKDQAIQEKMGSEKGAEAASAAKNACGIIDSDSNLAKAAKYMLCAVDKLVKVSTNIPVVGPFLDAIWQATKEMITYSGGFLKYLFGSGSILFPVGMTLSIYTLLTDQIVKLAELFVVVTVSTVAEIMITVTMYRNIALLIGGEAELPGLSKLV
ncbi:MAG: hypothetical protein QXF35_02340 [Candidatus Bilamarchaeaceae archaeon]